MAEAKDNKREEPATPANESAGEVRSEARSSGRVLDQDEIDSLLDFDESDSNGIREYIKSAVVSYGRLPLLETVFENLADRAARSLRGFTSGPAEVDFEGAGSIRFGAYLGSMAGPGLLAIFRAREWNNFGILAIDADLVYALLDVLFGGRRGTSGKRAAEREFTNLERDLIGQLAQLVLEDQARAFEGFVKVRFDLDRLETNPGLAAIARAGSAAVFARFEVQLGGRHGKFDIVYPQATLEPVREVLAQRYPGEATADDGAWRKQLSAAAHGVELPLTAVLDEQTASLKDVSRLEVGQTLEFRAGSKPRVLLKSGGVGIAAGRLGRSGSRYAVRIERNLLGGAPGKKAAS